MFVIPVVKIIALSLNNIITDGRGWSVVFNSNERERHNSRVPMHATNRRFTARISNPSLMTSINERIFPARRFRDEERKKKKSLVLWFCCGSVPDWPLSIFVQHVCRVQLTSWLIAFVNLFQVRGDFGWNINIKPTRCVGFTVFGRLCNTTILTILIQFTGTSDMSFQWLAEEGTKGYNRTELPILTSPCSEISQIVNQGQQLYRKSFVRSQPIVYYVIRSQNWAQCYIKQL